MVVVVVVVVQVVMVDYWWWYRAAATGNFIFCGSEGVKTNSAGNEIIKSI